MFEIEIGGEVALKDALSLLSKKMQREIGFEAVVTAMTPVVSRAKRYARRSMDTGNLHDSIGIKSTPRLKKGRLYAIVGPRRKFRKADPSGKGFRVATKIAHLVEFGTSKSAAKPFMRPAWAVEKNKVEKRLGETFGKRTIEEAKAAEMKFAGKRFRKRKVKLS